MPGWGSRAAECLVESEWTGYLWVLLFFVRVWGVISNAEDIDKCVTCGLI